MVLFYPINRFDLIKSASGELLDQILDKLHLSLSHPEVVSGDDMFSPPGQKDL